MEVIHYIQNSWVHRIATQNDWVFTTMETVHFMGLSLLLGSVAIMDLRILGILKRIPLPKLFDLVPLAMTGFAIQVISGFTMFSAEPAKYWGNIGFRIKMGALLLAGINALWFWRFEHRKLVSAAPSPSPAVSAKLTAVLSLCLWLLVLTFGRILTYLDGVQSNSLFSQ